MVEISRCEIEKYDEFLWRILFIEKASCRSFLRSKIFSNIRAKKVKVFLFFKFQENLFLQKERFFFFKIYNGDRAYFFHLGQQDTETFTSKFLYS